MEQNCTIILANAKKWYEFSNTRFLQYMRENASKFFSKDEFKGSNELDFEKSDFDRTNSHQFVCIESIENKKRNIFLIQEEEKDKTNYSVLLFSGECETSGLQWNNINDFFKEQIEADEKAFQRGIIEDPIYDMLRTVSKFIENRKTQFSITFTGKRCIVYHNKMTEHMITVNPKDGWFVLNNSETKYNDYMPTVSKENLLQLDIPKGRLQFEDKLDSDLVTVVDKIKETWKDCELTLYLGREPINILCGRGEETKNRKVINKVGNQIFVQEDPSKLPL